MDPTPPDATPPDPTPPPEDRPPRYRITCCVYSGACWLLIAGLSVLLAFAEGRGQNPYGWLFPLLIVLSIPLLVGGWVLGWMVELHYEHEAELARERGERRDPGEPE